MRLQSLLITVLALVFGGSAAVGVNSYLKNRGPAAVKVDTVAVVMTAMEIPRGRTITADLLTTRDYPKAMVPTGALTKTEEAIDRAVAIPMVMGEPVLEAKLSPKGAGRGLAALVPMGMRAVTIRTPNVATGVAGLVLPGNRVDVLLTVNDIRSSDDSFGGSSTTTLLQMVEILAVDQRVDAPAENKVDAKELRSVTLLVTPHQANLLDLGQNKGTLHLSLRNHDDDQDSRAQPVTLSDLRFRREKPWDERLKGVIAAYAQAQAKRPATAAAVPVVAKIPDPPVPVRIRTIRGQNEGSVHVHSVAPAASGRLAGGSSN